MRAPKDMATVRAKMIEHLEAALALTDEINDNATRYLIETALDGLWGRMPPASLTWPDTAKERQVMTHSP